MQTNFYILNKKLCKKIKICKKLESVLFQQLECELDFYQQQRLYQKKCFQLLINL